MLVPVIHLEIIIFLQCSSSASPRGYRLLNMQNLSFIQRHRFVPLSDQRIYHNASSFIKCLIHNNLCFFMLIVVHLASTPCLVSHCHRTTSHFFVCFYLELFDLLQMLKGHCHIFFLLFLKHILDFIIQARSLRHHCCLRIIFESKVDFIKLCLLIFLLVLFLSVNILKLKAFFLLPKGIDQVV